MAEQNDIARFYREFEEAFVDVLTAKGELLLPRQGKLYQARTRLRAHKDFAQREYDAAVLTFEETAEGGFSDQRCRSPDVPLLVESGSRLSFAERSVGIRKRPQPREDAL